MTCFNARVFLFLGMGFVFIYLLFGVQSTYAFSVAPVPLKLDAVYSSIPTHAKMILGVADAKPGTRIMVQKKGPDARFIRLSAGLLTVASGTPYIEYPFLIDGYGARPGSYNAQLLFVALNARRAANGTLMNVGLTNDIFFSVTTTPIHSLRIAQTMVDAEKWPHIPLTLALTVENAGNQPEQITNGVLWLYRNGSLVNNQEFLEVKSLLLPRLISSSTIMWSFPTTTIKESGQYDTIVQVRTESGLIVERRSTVNIFLPEDFMRAVSSTEEQTGDTIKPSIRVFSIALQFVQKHPLRAFFLGAVLVSMLGTVRYFVIHRK